MCGGCLPDLVQRHEDQLRRKHTNNNASIEATEQQGRLEDAPVKVKLSPNDLAQKATGSTVSPQHRRIAVVEAQTAVEERNRTRWTRATAHENGSHGGGK